MPGGLYRIAETALLSPLNILKNKKELLVTREKYKQMCEKLNAYTVLENKISNLEDFNTHKNYIDNYLAHDFDDDLLEKLCSLAEAVINEQISRLEKKLEEL